MRGWYNNKHNHRMASKGVKTKLNNFSIKNILQNSSDPYLSNLDIKYAWKIDKDKYIIVAKSSNPEDSNLMLYDIYEAKKKHDKFDFELLNSEYGMKNLKKWLDKRGI